jgi:ribosomal-protein-alanine N-acetyltransferase
MSVERGGSEPGARATAVRAIDPRDRAELALVATLEQRCFDDPWTTEDLDPLFGAEAVAGFVVAHGDSGPLGYALFQLLPDESELLRIGVVPEARDRGLGRALLGAALERLDRSGRPRCHLEVRAGNLSARALYERLGFVLAGRRKSYYGDGEDALRYLRSPAPAGG